MKNKNVPSVDAPNRSSLGLARWLGSDEEEFFYANCAFLLGVLDLVTSTVADVIACETIDRGYPCGHATARPVAEPDRNIRMPRIRSRHYYEDISRFWFMMLSMPGIELCKKVSFKALQLRIYQWNA